MLRSLILPLAAAVIAFVGCVSQTKTLSSSDIVDSPDDRQSVLWVKIRKYEELVAEFPDEPKHYERLAAFHWQLGHHEEALDYIAEAEKLDPTNAELRYMRAMVHEGSGNYRLAEKSLQQVAKEIPHYTGPHYDLAWLYISENRFRDALKQFEMCLEIDPVDPLPHYYIGKLQYERFRNREAAIQSFERYMELGGKKHHNEVRQVLAALQPDLRLSPAGYRAGPVIR